MVEIPSYQIHKVMKVYTKQLTQSKMFEGQNGPGKKTTAVDQITISVEGNRQAIINKVAAGVVERITRSGPKDEFDQGIVSRLEGEIGKKMDFAKSQKSQFVFNVIDDKNEKKINTISIEDSKYLIQRLEQLAKEAVAKNMES